MKRPKVRNRIEQLGEFVNEHYGVFLVPFVFVLHRVIYFLTDPFTQAIRIPNLYERIFLNLGLLIFCTLIVLGSIRISRKLNKLLPWEDTPLLRMLAQLIAQLVLAAVWILAYTFIIGHVLFDINIFTVVSSENFDATSKLALWRLLYTSMLVSLITSIIITARNFRLQTAELKLNASHLKQVALQAELQSLKLQLDPHFMFNNFSTLSALIEENKNLAQSFIEHLSRVYRYMVQNMNHDTTPLKKELKFIESYIYLITIRHGSNVKVEIDVPEEYLEKNIPPITLQLLIENAIKHNIASPAQPLHISIAVEDNCLVVANNLQRLSSPAVISSKIGLENIKARYRILGGQEPGIRETASIFCVELPLLD